MSGKHAYVTAHQFFYFIYIYALFGFNLDAIVANFGIQVNQVINLKLFLFTINIHLIKEKYYRNFISFGRNQKSIYKTGKSGRIVQSDQQKNLI